MTRMEDFRARIDAIDERIVAALGQRFAVCREVAAHKHRHGIPMMQPGRIEEVHRRLRELAHRHRVEPETLERLYEAIIESSCALEESIISELAASER